jgi:ATP-dependent Clp protease ATP-binding subunit ClpA
MKKELKNVLDMGYEVARGYKKQIYSSEHLLIAIMNSDLKEAKFLNTIGIYSSAFYNKMHNMYGESINMYKHQEMQVSELIKRVIIEDSTASDALYRIVNNNCAAKYFMLQINHDAINLIKQYIGKRSYEAKPENTNYAEMNNDFIAIENNLKRFVIGQDNTITSIINIIRRRAAGISSSKRPIGTVLFVGPTGVGKTELAKKIADEVFEGHIIRLDMSEYQEAVSITKLIGSAPGYIGYEVGGQLTEAVKNNPLSVVLFDEIEKAHPSIYNTLLQILDEGRLTDNKGVTVNFSDTLIILTSNIGAGTCKTSLEYKAAIKTCFKPEFINRLNDISIFNSLSEQMLMRIAEKELSILAYNLKTNKNITVQIASGVLIALFQKYSIDTQYGAREIKRVIIDKIEDKLSDAIITNKISSGNIAKIAIINGDIQII